MSDRIYRTLADAEQIEARIVEAEKLRAALEEVRRLHQPMVMPIDGRLLMVCSHCCFEEGSGMSTEDCLDSHEHTADGPACATAEIIARAGL